MREPEQLSRISHRESVDNGEVVGHTRGEHLSLSLSVDGTGPRDPIFACGFAPLVGEVVTELEICIISIVHP